MSQLDTQVQIGTWIPISWEEFIKLTKGSACEKIKAYYYNGRMRLEDTTVLGNPHSRDHGLVIGAMTLFTSLRGLDIDGHDNCTYRKTGCFSPRWVDEIGVRSIRLGRERSECNTSNFFSLV